MPSSKRQKELARRRAERQNQRRAQMQAARRKRNLLVYGGVFGLVLLLVLGLTVGRDWLDSEPSAEATPTPSASASVSASPAPPGVCDPKGYTADAADNTGGKKPGLPAGKSYGSAKTVPTTLTLAQGTVTFDMYADKAPCTANSFAHLASKNFFDGTECHRLTTDGIFVLQCGDPTGTGSGGPGYTIPDENLAGATYPAGTVAMANTGQPHTGGSQFFLVYQDTQLPAQYTPFGKITGGLDVLKRIAAKGVTGGAKDGKPAEKVGIVDFATAAPK